MEKLLTVIVPTYNMEKYLRHGLDSLIVSPENMKRLEVLIVIDGATDKSTEIGHEYQDRYPDTFIVIDKENGNYGSCINRGLKDAHGKYVKIMDADDSYDIKAFDSYITFLHGVDSDMVFNDYSLINEDGRIIRSVKYNLPKGPFPFKEIRKPLFNSIVMHGVSYKTEKLRQMNYHQTEGISYTDMEWAFIPCFMVKTAAYFNHCLYLYLFGREGQTVDPVIRAKRMSHENKVMEKMLLAYRDLDNKDIESNKYLEFRLQNRICNLYLTYLTNKAIGIDGLREFDGFFKKEYVDYYTKSENFSLTNMVPFKFIKWWRENKEQTMLPSSMRALYYLSSKYTSLLKRIFNYV